MSIQWYPGHMAKTRRAMAKAFPSQDVIIEVLDARMPYASSNPIVTALRKQKPCIKLLSKADLADPVATRAWVQHFETPASSLDGKAPGQVVVLPSSSDKFAETKNRLQSLCIRLSGRKPGPLRPVRAIIVGIPNVGKSTLVNVLMGRKVAKVGDEPAVTKAQQRVVLPSGIAISDNPGMLWPKIADANMGYRLAFGGAVSEAALDYEPVARYGAGLLLERYSELLQARYKLKALPTSADELLMEIGRRRGCLRSGGVVDLHKAADVLIHDFRSGAIGRISLELPSDIVGLPCDESSDLEDDSIDSTDGESDVEGSSGDEGDGCGVPAPEVSSNEPDEEPCR